RGEKLRVGPVLRVQVDAIDSEPACTRTCLGHDLYRKPDREQFCGEEHFIATISNRLTDDAFRLPKPVDLRCVDEAHAEVERAMHDLHGLAARVVRAISPLAGAELPCAEPDRRHPGAADLDVLQESPLSRRS